MKLNTLVALRRQLYINKTEQFLDLNMFKILNCNPIIYYVKVLKYFFTNPYYIFLGNKHRFLEMNP